MSSGPITTQKQVAGRLKADLDAVNLEVESAVYLEVCKRLIEAMIVVNLKAALHRLVAPKGAGGYRYRTLCIYIYIYISAGPFVGHQAVWDMFQVYNNHCFNRSFANFKVHSTSNFNAYSIILSLQSSCNLFLCCYRATGHSHYPHLGGCSQTRVSPGIPPTSTEFSILFSSIVDPRMTLKTDLNSP